MCFTSETCEDSRKRKSCRKALVEFGELVMLMTIENTKDKGKIDANTIRLDLVDRSDGVVVGAAERVVKTRIVCRVSKEQRDGARDSERSLRGECSIDRNGHGTES